MVKECFYEREMEEIGLFGCCYCCCLLLLLLLPFCCCCCCWFCCRKGKRGREFGTLGWRERVLSNEVIPFIPLFIASNLPQECVKCPYSTHHSTLHHALWQAPCLPPSPWGTCMVREMVVSQPHVGYFYIYIHGCIHTYVFIFIHTHLISMK